MFDDLLKAANAGLRIAGRNDSKLEALHGKVQQLDDGNFRELLVKLREVLELVADMVEARRGNA